MADERAGASGLWLLIPHVIYLAAAVAALQVAGVLSWSMGRAPWAQVLLPLGVVILLVKMLLAQRLRLTWRVLVLCTAGALLLGGAAIAVGAAVPAAVVWVNFVPPLASSLQLGLLKHLSGAGAPRGADASTGS